MLPVNWSKAASYPSSSARHLSCGRLIPGVHYVTSTVSRVEFSCGERRHAAQKDRYTGWLDAGAEEIQGDVLIGLQKNVEAFLLFDIVGVDAFKTALAGSLGKITFSDVTAAREDQLATAKANKTPAPNLISANILFSRGGLAKLADLGGAAFGDAFLRSVDERARFLKDPASALLPAFREDAEAVLLITTADEASLALEVAAWRAALGNSIVERHVEIGRVRPGGAKGHEHFGFLDGVSQPGVEGLTEPGQHAPGAPPGDPKQGLPGQDLIKPGAFVLGYDNQDDTFAEPPLDWMRNGSFMVLRRLEQQVLFFRSFLVAAAAAAGTGADQFAARLIGRWQSGAPIMLAGAADDPARGADPFRNNDFDFNADSHQEKCPFLSHIRKSYPRDDLDFTSAFPKKGEGEAFAETHRILRAGIPFGFEIDPDPEFGPHEHVGREASRGLMFVSYQSSLDDGFEFIQAQ